MWTGTLYVADLYGLRTARSPPSIFLRRASGQRREPCPSRSIQQAVSQDSMWTETRCFTASCEKRRERSACLLTIQTQAGGGGGKENNSEGAEGHRLNDFEA